MKYLYTTKPDEHCHEVEPGIWGRPVQTYEQPELRKKGWTYTVNELKEAGDGLREEEGREEKEVRKAEADKWAEVGKEFYERETDFSNEQTIFDAYEEKFGKKPHHKMKPETIRKKLGESDA